MGERRPSLARLLQAVHRQGLVVHSVEVTPGGYLLTTAPQGAPAPVSDLDEARENRRRAREARRAQHGHKAAG